MAETMPEERVPAHPTRQLLAPAAAELLAPAAAADMPAAAVAVDAQAAVAAVDTSNRKLPI
jgi:hypothetical protein